MVAEARGKAAQLMEQAEGYRAQTINEAEGEASDLSLCMKNMQKHLIVTRKRLYLETIEKVYGSVNKVVIDESSSGQGVVPYLPLNELTKQKTGGN